MLSYFGAMVMRFKTHRSEIAAGGIVAFQSHPFLLLSDSVNSKSVLHRACE